MPGPEDTPESKDQKPTTPQRLQGLSSRGGRGGLRGGRFAPNAVGRRSKEERESTAPALKPQGENEDKKRPPQRGRMERRKPRQMGTRGEAAGPLAAPTIASSSGRVQPPSLGSTGETVSHGTAPRSVKSEQEIESMQAHLIVGDDGRIDVASGGNGEAFFPLRVPSAATTLPDEPVDSAANEAKAAPEAPGELEAKLDDAHAAEVLNLEEGQLYLIQLPRMGQLSAGKTPKGAPLTDDVKKEDVEMTDAPPAGSEDPAVPPAEDAPGPEGLLGSLRRHASGKTTLLIGDAVFDVSLGSPSVSVEDVVLLNDEGHVAYSLGSVKNRVLVTPNLDSLHI